MAEDNLPEGFVVDQPATTFSDLPEGFKIDQQRRNYLPSTVSGAVSSFLEPITSYPATYSEMNKEAREQVGHGIGQLTDPKSGWDVVKGAGNVALGTVNYVGSPINAGLRTVVGKPLEENIGVPEAYSEFAAGLAIPGIGLTRAAKTASTVPSSKKLYDAATAAYEAPEVAALKMHPKTMTFFGEDAAAALKTQGYDPLLAPKTFGLLEKATVAPDGSQFVTANNVQTIRRMLGKAAESPDKTERAAAQIAQRKLDDFMANIPRNAVLEGDATAASKILQDARGNYAAASRSDRFQNALELAEKQAARAGVGGNLENATRQRITSILNSPAKSRGLSSVEKSALEDYVQGTFTRNSLRVATKVLGGDNPLMAAIHAGFAYSTYGVSLAAPLTGFALKKINNAISAKELIRLDELLRSRSPLAKETSQAITNWTQAGGALTQQPTTQNATRFFAASQFLGNKFESVGVNADIQKLMEPFQSPGAVPAAAQPEQNKRYATGGSVFDKMHAAKHMQEGGGLSSFLEGEYSGNKEGQHGGGYLGIESPTGNAGIGGQGWRENTPEGRLGRASITNVDVGHKIGDLNLTGSYRANQREIARPPAGDNTYFDPIEHSGQKFRMPNDIDKRFMLGLSKQFSDGGSVFDKMHMARKRAEGGGTDVPFNEWDAVPRNAEGIPQIRIEKPPVNEADEAQAAREAAAARIAGNVRGAPYEPTPPSTEGKTWMMEPGMEAMLSGNYEMPPNVRLNDANIPYNVETGEELQMARRPNVLPFTRTPDGVPWAMPKIAELAGYIGNPLAVTKGLALKPGEFALGSGPIKRSVLEQPNAPTFYSALDRAVSDIPQAKASAEQWAATLANRPGVKPEEIQWRGLDQYLAGRAGQTVTKQEIADHLAGNKVEFGSVVKGGKEPFDAKRLSQLESEYSSLKQHPIDDPSFGEAKYDELIRLMNIRDQSTTDTLYSAAEQAMRNGQRAQQRGDKIAADRYFKEHEMLNTRAEKLALEGLGLANPPKYSGYQLPGGENYSEKLLTLPNQWEAPRAAQVANEAKIKALRQEMHGTSGTNEIRAEIRSLQDANAALQKQISASPIYKSPHWDEPNPVTHMRTNERTIGNTSSHHIEEVQSDWHQKGRTEGYADPDPAKRDIAARELLTAESELKKQIRRSDQSHYKEAIDNQVEFHANPERDVEFAEQWFGPEQQSAALRYMAAKREFSALAGGVPDAPFKKTWPDLTMKQALRDAVEGGKDRLSWTPGEAQAKRYDLSKQVDHIKVEGVTEAPGVHFVDIKPKSGAEINLEVENGIIREGEYKGKPLADIVGKEMAEKITSVESGHKEFTGDNLKIGGEGMNEFYDKMLPKAVEKLGKAYGVKVQRGVDTTGNPVNYVDIPPAWKQEILKKGFPLFASGGSVFDKMKRASK